MERIGLLAPDDQLLGLLGGAIQTSPNSISGIRFNVINGVLISDAYIYRLSFPSRAADTAAAEAR